MSFFRREVGRLELLDHVDGWIGVRVSICSIVGRGDIRSTKPRVEGGFEFFHASVTPSSAEPENKNSDSHDQ